MTKPIPEVVDPLRLSDLALGVMTRARFPNLATIDGDQPRVRPVSPVKTDGFTVYVANLRNYHKTVEIAANPRGLSSSTSTTTTTRSGSPARRGRHRPGSPPADLGRQPAPPQLPWQPRQPRSDPLQDHAQPRPLHEGMGIDYHEVPLGPTV